MVDFGAGKKLSPEAVPFGEIVGQTELKEALLTVVSHPDLDGLLVDGEKGTAKSTAVRGLVDLLPEQQAVADCPYGCPPSDPSRQCTDCQGRSDPPVERRQVPLVTLPLGATRERVVGSLSVSGALSGAPEFEPGLLARANRGLLYVDEVNLLDDHLVDVLLDAAASGVNHVERDGVSVAHPAEFTLIGTMNPEEGDLRPQLRDRFALRVAVTGSDDLDDRVAIIDRALGDDETPDRPDPQAATAAARDRLRSARDALPDVTLPETFKTEIAELCRDAGVDGHRADIATARAAMALAALDGRRRVIEPDVRRAAEWALPHRMRTDPFADAPDASEVIEDRFDDSDPNAGADEDDASERTRGDGTDGNGDAKDGDDDRRADKRDADGEYGDDPDPPDRDGDGRSENPDPDPADGDGSERGDGTEDASPAGGVESAAGSDTRSDSDGRTEASDDEGPPDDEGGSEDRSDDPEEATPLLPGQSRPDPGTGSAPEIDGSAFAAEGETTSAAAGGRTTRRTTDGEGVRVRTEHADGLDDLDAAASVRAAASRGADAVGRRDLRRSVRETTGSALVVVAVDASASMRGPMRAAKGVVLDLLRDAYEQRDAVAVVAFAGDAAEVVLPPTESVSLAARHLKDLPVADRTPLPDGLRTAAEVIDRAAPAASVAVVVSDGRANVADGSPTAETRSAAATLGETADEVLVVDAGDDGKGLLDDLVATTDARRLPLDALTPDRIEGAVVAARER